MTVPLIVNAKRLINSGNANVIKLHALHKIVSGSGLDYGIPAYGFLGMARLSFAPRTLVIGVSACFRTPRRRIYHTIYN